MISNEIIQLCVFIGMFLGIFVGASLCDNYINFKFKKDFFKLDIRIGAWWRCGAIATVYEKSYIPIFIENTGKVSVIANIQFREKRSFAQPSFLLYLPTERQWIEGKLESLQENNVSIKPGEKAHFALGLTCLERFQKDNYRLVVSTDFGDIKIDTERVLDRINEYIVTSKKILEQEKANV